jgi:two-component system, response regulator PdtaR
MASVLIVENDPILALHLQDVVTEIGHKVIGVAATFRRALELAGHNPPDLALIDYRLDGIMDGVVTARRLRERFGTKIVYVTASEHEVRLIDGSAVIVPKPLDENQLRQAVATVLASAEREPPQERAGPGGP